MITRRSWVDRNEIRRLAAIAVRLRRNVVEMIGIGKAGHLGGSCSLAEIVAALYFSRLRFNPRDITDPDRDRFILSKGHSHPVCGACRARRDRQGRALPVENSRGDAPGTPRPGTDTRPRGCDGVFGTRALHRARNSSCVADGRALEPCLGHHG